MKEIIISSKGDVTLLEELNRQNIYVSADCSGRGMCGKCKVRFVSKAPDPTKAEKNIISKGRLDQGWRLACLCRVTGDVHLEIPQRDEDMKVELDLGSFPALVKKKQSGGGREAITIDIGTTTIGAARIDITSGATIATASRVNHQRAYGSDVISRIEASNNGKGQELAASIKEDLEAVLDDLGVDSSKNIPIVISGNTTMGHLLLGYSCKGLGVAPYEPVNIGVMRFDNVLLLPGISTFVGADIASGICACGMDKSDKVCALIDLGTNGEMAVGNKDKILVTSTAAGPAFEGGNISMGVAGVPGAIARVEIKGGEAFVKTIDDKDAIGICGSGVLEATYELVKAGIVDETGLMDEEYFDGGFPLTESVVFTQKDVREVQLAKSAIRAGLETLIDEYGVTLDEVETLYLAGGFGKKIDVAKAAGMGMIPRSLADKTVAIGNSSLQGAIMVACDEEVLESMEEVCQKASEVVLASSSKFNESYMDNMFFD